MTWLVALAILLLLVFVAVPALRRDRGDPLAEDEEDAFEVEEWPHFMGAEDDDAEV